MFELFLLPETWISLLSLTLLEIVLGIDNIIFISILAGKLPQEQRNRARVMGLVIALFGRLLLLSGIAWLTQLTEPWISIDFLNLHFSGKDIVLLLGGLFLIAKSAHEIYDKAEGDEHTEMLHPPTATFRGVIFQIILIDMVFSLDSIITAIGLVPHVIIMVIAILISLGVMIVSANGIGNFIDRHPSIKLLALSFLLMIGTLLVAEAFHYEIPKGYIYFSLAFALFVEFLNIRSGVRKPTHALDSASDRGGENH